MLPALFGRHSRDGVANEVPMPLAVLERLMRLAFAQTRPDDDNSHARGAAVHMRLTTAIKLKARAA